MEDNIDELITDFLLGKMDPASRSHFEQRLAAEPDLAARVALEQDIAAALNSHSPENQLRANLNRIADKYPSPESLQGQSEGSKGWKKRIPWALGALLLLVASLLSQRFLKEQTPAPQEQILQTAPAGQETQKAPEAEKSNTEKRRQPMAAALKPLPELEAYIGSQRRSGDFRIQLAEPKSGASFHLDANAVAFRVSGKLEGTLPAGAGLHLMVFSNKENDFKALRPLFEQALDIQADGKFLFKKQWSASPGLYYLVIEDQQSGEWLLVDKFWVV